MDEDHNDLMEPVGPTKHAVHPLFKVENLLDHSSPPSHVCTPLSLSLSLLIGILVFAHLNLLEEYPSGGRKSNQNPSSPSDHPETSGFSGGNSMALVGIPSEIMASGVGNSFDWWNDVNRSPLWQDRIFHTLAGLFGFVAAVALIQLVRIQLRVPEYGWTTQKVFHFLNFVVNAVRCVVFVFRRDIQLIKPEIIQHILLDLPSLVFFTTYALLVLFWAEIYYQARAVSTDGLRPSFFTINAVVYAIQVVMWLLLWWKPVRVMLIISKMFFAGVSLFAAFGFLLYGGRLFLMLQRFPVESKGRRKKLQEVGYVTTICFTCFLIRCVMMCFNAFDKAADLDVLNHPILNFIYYLLVEIVPCALVLFILRKLPPRRGITQYQPIH